MRRGRQAGARVWRRPLVADVAVLAALALYAVPFLWQLLTSFKPEAELLRVPPLWPSRLTLEHYQVVFAQSAMPRALANSFGVGLLTTMLACALGVPAAYAMATLRVPAAGALMLGVVVFLLVMLVAAAYLRVLRRQEAAA